MGVFYRTCFLFPFSLVHSHQSIDAPSQSFITPRCLHILVKMVLTRNCLKIFQRLKWLLWFMDKRTIDTRRSLCLSPVLMRSLSRSRLLESVPAMLKPMQEQRDSGVTEKESPATWSLR